ncbi:helix-turn-helix transcriptional regulator [Phocaeicola vulgatus]|uniref:helix-turn-helix transcriptional regulator n=1 Tax=Phocaeicola vulgatus TaxID=821 RepID=UPI00189E873C|nr:helix-turn-helix transcriptional regulator [Phocaeicola vulgatus]
MNRIKEVLEEKGIKQTWLAEKIGKSFSQTNAYVCNRRQPSIELLYEIASLLGVEAKDLLVDNIELKVSSINSIYPLVSDSRTL